MVMELIYKGKTKDVYKMENGHYQLVFKDDATGENGVFDPGANTVGLRIEGMGKENLRMSVYFFELLAQKGIRTHYVSADPNRGVMEVIPAKVFGQGLEVICRYRAVGSFHRRYGAYMALGTPLDGYVEMTLKDDGRGDPLVTKEGLSVLGIVTEAQYDRLHTMTREICGHIKAILAEKDLELYDIKLEFGLADDEVLLIDEITTGNMRVYQNGASVGPMALAKLVLQ